MLAQVIAGTMLLLGKHWPVLARGRCLWMWGVVGVAMILGGGLTSANSGAKIDDGIKRRRRVELLLLDREEKRERLRARRREARALEGEERGY